MKHPDATGLAEEQPLEIDISMADDVFIKQVVIPKAGTLMPQHSHVFDHTSLLAVGRMRVWSDDVCLGDFEAPCPITIKGGTRHSMLALSDGVTFYCIHNTARAGVIEVLEPAALPQAPDLIEPDRDGFVIAEEPWSDFWRDGQALFAQHEAAIGGPRDGVPIAINTELVDKLDAVGGALVMTLRSNGRMFGYLCTVVSPAIENSALLVGTTTAFYVSPAAQGYGPRLLRATIELLRRRGVHEVMMRAGTRGDGPRMGALYRRLGAKPAGEMYGLMLKAV